LIFSIKGRHKNSAAVEEYVQNLCRELKIAHLKKAEFSIRFVTKCDTDALGLCWDDAEEIEVEISRTCEGEPLTFFEQMQTIAHEMVHVKQFIRKEYPSEREAKKLEFELYAKCFPWKLVT
jgi:hypothetical protein